MTTTAIQRKYWSVVISSLDTLLAAPGTSDTALKEQRDIFKLLELFVAERQGTPPSHAAWQRLLRDQVPLKVWRRCSQLAATSNVYKQTAAVVAAYAPLVAAHDAGILPERTKDGVATTAMDPGSVRIVAKLHQQLQDSGLLQQLPALITSAARQLQAAAGVQPATGAAVLAELSRAARYETTEFAENRGVNIITLAHMIHRLTPVYLASSSIGATCLLPAQHLALAMQQYLSTVPALQPGQQDGATSAATSAGSIQHGMVLTACQQKLSLRSLELVDLCSNAVSVALRGDPSPIKLNNKSAAKDSTPSTMIAHAAVLTRHHIECISLYVATMQLALQVKRHQQQQQASSPPASASGQQLLSEMVGQVPASVQRLLRHLGCSTYATLWQAVHNNEDLSCSQIETQLNGLGGACTRLCIHSQSFLLQNAPPKMPQPLLLELQQHLQLHMLLPGVLLQWVADKPSTDSNYSECSQFALGAAQDSGSFYYKVLQEGPSSLYQHMTGHNRPQLPVPDGLKAHQKPRVVVSIPTDVHDCQLELLDRVLPSMLQLWRDKLVAAKRNEESSAPLPAVSSAPGIMLLASSSSSPSVSHAVRYTTALDDDVCASSKLWIIDMAFNPPAHRHGPVQQDVNSVGIKAFHSRAASTTAAKLCVLLEDITRMELAADQQAPATVASEGSTSGNLASSDSCGKLVGAKSTTARLRILGVVQKCLAPDAYSFGFQVGSLADPIIINHGPGSKASKQLCSLITTVLKGGAWVTSTVPAGSKSAQVAAASCKDIFKAVCGVVDAETDKVLAVLLADSPHSSSAGDHRNNTASHETTAMLPWLVLLGRCCLQSSCHLHLPAPVQMEVPREAAAAVAAGQLQVCEGRVTAVQGVDSSLQIGQAALQQAYDAASSTLASNMLQAGVQTQASEDMLDTLVIVAKGWLSAGSHTAQVAALGYDAEGLLQRLHSAEATSSELHARMRVESVPLKTLVPELQQHLQSVGIALTSFAHPGACNNPFCSNPAGPSEGVLVQSKTSRCSVCRASKYCSKACQVFHWKQHKHVCKPLAAAAAAAAAASASGAAGTGDDKG